MTRQYSFQGGINLPQRLSVKWSECTDQALGQPIMNMPLPERLVYPLQTRRGIIRRPLVNAGDSVVSGQLLAIDDLNREVPLLASAAGTIERITADITLKTAPDTPATFSGSEGSGSDQEKLQLLGIQGLGGAAFASFAKLDSCADNAIESLIINAAECEPLICCDQALIREHSIDILLGIELLLTLSGAQQCLIGIEDSMQAEIQLLSNALQSSPSDNIELVVVPARYPTGSEKQLIQVLTGKSIPATQLPRDQGVVCFNIATAYAVKQALLENRAQIDRVVTVTGTAVDKPGNIRLKFGTRLEDLLSWLGISTEAHPFVTLGGPISGQQIDIKRASVSAATNCLVIDHAASSKPAIACIRCGECDKVCPANLLPQQLHWFCRDNNLNDAEKFHLSACIECGCCDFVCPSNIALTPQFRQAKHDAAEQHRLAELAVHAQSRFDARTERLARKENLKQLKLQQRKDALEKKRASRNPGMSS